MSDEQQRKEVFAWFGAASYYAQCVECELWIARLVLVRGRESPPSKQEWEQIEGEGLTMGKLMRLVERGIGMETTELDALQACVEKRNWLSHGYWTQRSHLLVSSDGRQQAVDELTDLCEVFKRGDDVARGISARIRARVGISEHLVQELQDEYVQRLQSGESHEVILQEQEERFKGLSPDIADGQEQNCEHDRNSSPEG